jgi:glycerol-3-phosphate acyltransferase PlsY
LESFQDFQVLAALLAAAIGYLLGNVQTSILISKFYFHDDVRGHGSGNAGSTNMLRVFGLRPGALTFIGDFSKAIIAVLLGRLVMGVLGGYIAGLFVVIGHCWPVFAGFRGGKGVASTVGIGIMVFPLGGVAAIVVGALLVLFTRRVSLMSLSGVLAFLIMVLIFRLDNLALVILTVLLFVLVYVRHIDNIKRLIKGEEKPLRNS